MNLKLLAVLTIISWLVLFTLAIIYKVPVAYVPESATTFEYEMYTVAFLTVEAVLFSYLFAHMMMKSKLKLYGDLTNIFK